MSINLIFLLRQREKNAELILGDLNFSNAINQYEMHILNIYNCNVVNAEIDEQNHYSMIKLVFFSNIS